MGKAIRKTEAAGRLPPGQTNMRETIGVVAGTEHRPAAKRGPAPLSREEIDREARPGESYEEAGRRIATQRERERQASAPRPAAARPVAWNPEIALCARELVLVTLPHSEPAAPAFLRTNGTLSLVIRSGKDPATGEPVGIPYGSIPRLLLYYIVAEINRTGKPRVNLGRSWAELARKLGLESGSGGKRSVATHLKEQLRRLLAAEILFVVADPGRLRALLASGKPEDAAVLAGHSIRWWNAKDPGADAALESWLEVGNAFFQAVLTKPIPVRLSTVVALRKSPLALDLYVLLCRESALAAGRGHGRVIEWKWLMEQMGSDYKDVKDFGKYAKKTLETICRHYSKLKARVVRGGIEIQDDTLPDVETRS